MNSDPNPIPWSQAMVWSVRRELWENRSIYIAPLAVAPLAIIAFVFNALRLPEKMRGPAGQLHDAIQQPYDFVAGLLMAVTMIVAVVYSLDALYGERRDRSILFWKSLPVSDWITVLAKASIPIVVLPLLGFVITVVLQLIMAVISSVVLAANGSSVGAYWEQLSFGRMSLLLLYHLVAVHGLSWAPLFGWLLLVSAWVKRAPFAWAFLPPVVIGILERIAFGTSYLGPFFGARLSGAGSVMSTSTSSMPMDPMTTHATVGRFLSAPGFWIGLVLTALFLAAATRLRRYQVPN